MSANAVRTYDNNIYKAATLFDEANLRLGVAFGLLANEKEASAAAVMISRGGMYGELPNPVTVVRALKIWSTHARAEGEMYDILKGKSDDERGRLLMAESLRLMSLATRSDGRSPDVIEQSGENVQAR